MNISILRLIAMYLDDSVQVNKDTMLKNILGLIVMRHKEQIRGILEALDGDR